MRRVCWWRWPCGVERLLAAMRARQPEPPAEPVAQLLASGEGHVDLALGSPALFLLGFGSGLKVAGSPGLEAAGDAAMEYLAADLARLRGAEPFGYPEAWDEVRAIWSLRHGFADLLVSGGLKVAQDLAAAERAALFRRLVAQKLRLAEHLRI